MTTPKENPLPGGRPTLLNADRSKIICAFIRTGATAWVAANASGTTPNTYNRWMIAGKKNSEEAEAREAAGEPFELSIYGQFYRDVTEARAHCRVTVESKIKITNPLAWLTRGPGGRDRPGEEGWVNTDRVELTGRHGAPVTLAPATIDVTKLNDHELEQLDQLLARATNHAALLPAGDQEIGEEREGEA